MYTNDLVNALVDIWMKTTKLLGKMHNCDLISSCQDVGGQVQTIACLLMLNWWWTIHIFKFAVSCLSFILESLGIGFYA